MTRFNIFNQIHKALRAMLYDTSLNLQQTYFADADEAGAAVEKVNQVIDIFEEHAASEDHFVFPAIDKYEPSLADGNFTSARMMRSLSNTEISGWLKTVEKNSPQPVFSQLFSISKRELPNNRFLKVLQDMNGETIVA